MKYKKLYKVSLSRHLFLNNICKLNLTTVQYSVDIVLYEQPFITYVCPIHVHVGLYNERFIHFPKYFICSNF